MTSEFLRPGIYTRYIIEGNGPALQTERLAGLAALSAKGAGELLRLSTREEAQTALEGVALSMALLLLEAGCSPVLCAPVVDPEDAAAYRQALERLRQEGAYALCCDCDDFAVLEALRQTALAGRRLGFVGIGDPQRALDAAGGLNSERVAICCTGGDDPQTAMLGGAALAALALRQTVTGSLAGQALPGLPATAGMEEQTLIQLCRGGVTACEPVGGELRVLRAVTTRTRTGGLADRGFSSLGTICLVDAVLDGVEAALRARVQNGGATLEEIQTQTVVELGAQQEAGLLIHFETPTVQADPEDPAICLVGLRFTPASAVDTICLTAKVVI